MTLQEEALELRDKIYKTAPDAYKQAFPDNPWAVALLSAEAFYKNAEETADPTVEQEFPFNKMYILQFCSEYLWYSYVTKGAVSCDLFINRYNLTMKELKGLAYSMNYNIVYDNKAKYFVLQAVAGISALTVEQLLKINSFYSDSMSILSLCKMHNVSADTIYQVLIKAKKVRTPLYMHNLYLFEKIFCSMAVEGSFMYLLQKLRAELKVTPEEESLLHTNKVDSGFDCFTYNGVEWVGVLPDNIALLSNGARRKIKEAERTGVDYDLRRKFAICEDSAKYGTSMYYQDKVKEVAELMGRVYKPVESYRELVRTYDGKFAIKE